jgi:protein disulfide-isomerase
MNCSKLFRNQKFPIYFLLSNFLNADGKVNFEGLGNTGYVAGGATAWLAVIIK